ncbi:TIGR03618 family F420-dependent PPOX class oxidoreductase [Kitasatospora sp. CMC57]|uniref:TIGR03618 family F420-dependent PPOX class oxidoreductase n=1 Tax=Kitasatospora sp. CMC57 TaxID=3231513 RepID=A0AB33JKN9_9ACTN
MAHDLGALGDSFHDFWRERHLATFTTLRPDGTPHVAPVGVTYDPETRIARVISSGSSRKALNVLAAGEAGLRVAVCQVDGARWCTLEGRAVVRSEPEAVAEAVRRYTERYRAPRVNPARVAIEIAVDRVLGRF